MPYQRLARHVLEEWRLLERRLTALDLGSPEAEQLMAETHDLRDEYRHMIDEAEVLKASLCASWPFDRSGGAWTVPLPAGGWLA